MQYVKTMGAAIAGPLIMPIGLRIAKMAKLFSTHQIYGTTHWKTNYGNTAFFFLYIPRCFFNISHNSEFIDSSSVTGVKEIGGGWRQSSRAIFPGVASKTSRLGPPWEYY